MSTDCPNGHQSEWPDWCSICGERLGPVEAQSPESQPAAAQSPAAQAPAAQEPAAQPAHSPAAQASAAQHASSGPTCENCGVGRQEHDVFCESCGYDFASGSLPDAAPGSDADPAAVEVAPMHARITVDPDFFSASVGDVDLALPDPLPPQQNVPLAGIRILIGRQSTSRGIFPEIDVRALTDDPAVSSRHAMLERAADGSWTLTDLGSTNGTFLTADGEDAIQAGVALPVAAGTVVYLGAWTRLELAETG